LIFFFSSAIQPDSLFGPAHLPPSPSLMCGPCPLRLPPPAARPQHCRRQLVRALSPLSRPLLSQKWPLPPPFKPHLWLPGPPLETAAHHHQWRRPSSLQPTTSPPSSSPYKRARSTPTITTLTPTILCSLSSPQPPPHQAPTTASHPSPLCHRFITSRAPMSPQTCSPLPPPPPPPLPR
jgi:hypothetical protein